MLLACTHCIITPHSKVKFVISASAYLNGDVMKNEETGRQDKETYDRKSAMAGINTEAKQREQSREHSSLKDRLEKNKRIVAD